MGTINNTKPDYTITVDGSCSGNPGPGGWAAIITNGKGEEIVTLRGRELDTTNNRMELQPVIAGMEWCLDNLPSIAPGAVALVTDSEYAKNSMTTWMHGWKKNGWRTSDKKPVKNRDLLEKLDRLNTLVAPRWSWVKAHAGHDLNERADKIAREEMEQARKDASPFPDLSEAELLALTN